MKSFLIGLTVGSLSLIISYILNNTNLYIGIGILEILLSIVFFIIGYISCSYKDIILAILGACLIFIFYGIYVELNILDKNDFIFILLFRLFLTSLLFIPPLLSGILGAKISITKYNEKIS